MKFLFWKVVYYLYELAVALQMPAALLNTSKVKLLQSYLLTFQAEVRIKIDKFYLFTFGIWHHLEFKWTNEFYKLVAIIIKMIREHPYVKFYFWIKLISWTRHKMSIAQTIFELGPIPRSVKVLEWTIII